MKDRERILAVVHSARREYDRYEMDAGIVQERCRACLGEELDIDVRDVANDIVVIIHHSQGC